MADSVPIKGKVMTPPGRMAPEPTYRAETMSLPALTARFYQRMKRQRVYPLVVSWGKRNSASERLGSASPLLVVRPIVPGSLVVPAELPLEGGPDATATFQVTPLALGRLRLARVEVLHQARIVSTLRLKMIVVRQLISWVLLGLAIVVPWLLIQTTGDNALKSDKRTHLTPEEARPGQEDLLTRAQKPGEVLADRLYLGESEIPGITDKIREGVGQVYQYVCDTVKAVKQLPIYVCAGFLVLAFLSWLLHLSCRGQVRGQPLTLPR